MKTLTNNLLIGFIVITHTPLMLVVLMVNFIQTIKTGNND